MPDDLTDEEEIALEMERQEAATEQDLLDKIADAFGRADKGAEVEAVWSVVEAELGQRAEQAEAERDALKAATKKTREAAQRLQEATTPSVAAFWSNELLNAALALDHPTEGVSDGR